MALDVPRWRWPLNEESLMESNLDSPSVRDIGLARAGSEIHSSGVSWSAVIGGAFVAAAFYLILLALGAGLELSSLSPWSNGGVSESNLTNLAIAWLVLSEIIASALGGYLTGRQRVRWPLVHTDEVYFRDTANGFLAWAVALVIGATLLASAATFMVGHAAQFPPKAETSAVASDLAEPNGYFVDTLFRSAHAEQDNRDAVKAEGARIFSHALRQDQIPAADRSYLAQLIAGKTGISQSQAEGRISEVVTDARATDDAARKRSARLLIWLFFALIMGAFSASYAALVGGRQRDRVQAV
jgi:hypothetical protein